MLRWMAPFLSFTAEEAWTVFGNSESIFLERYSTFELQDDALLTKWHHLRDIRSELYKAIETLRTAGRIGSSLQAKVTLAATDHDMRVMKSLGNDLKFVFIVSEVVLRDDINQVDKEDYGTSWSIDTQLSFKVEPSQFIKCERCWHYRDDVGADTAHPTICGRCTINLYGAGESRHFA